MTDAEVLQINKMNVASQRADLGDVVQDNQEAITALQAGAVVSGSYTATLADADGSSIEILTGTTGIAGYIVQVYQTGSTMTCHVANSAGGSNLTITPTTTGSWSAIDAGDTVSWIVF
ncbi:MAG TPA: hypothetical protein VMX17_03075 [Candidatus Glassbacteria bacterium]|nr:hypothetical protein [Candidatus Glassbacteria bacterium]